MGITIEKDQVKRVLVITLSNIGDIILTTPVIETLKREFAHARIDVMVGPSGKELFEKDRRVFKLIIYDKHLPISAKRRLQLKLKKLRYDLVVDLRNTIFPLLIGPRYRTATIQRFPSGVIHSIDKHLHRLRSLGLKDLRRSSSVHIPEEDAASVSRLLEEEKIGGAFVVINPGAKSHLKRWRCEGFADVADRIIKECGSQVVFVGLAEDQAVIAEVTGRMKERGHNVAGRMNIRQLACLLKSSQLLITNDSAPLHLGCAVGVRVLALFGPTDPRKYGPTGEFDAVIHKKLHCAPCESATCTFHYECMTSIGTDEVFEMAKMMIEGYE